MDVTTFSFDCTEQKDFYFLLASDLHIGDRLFDKKRFKQDFDEALKKGARIYIIGDIMRLITVMDKKRYTRDEGKEKRHTVVDENIFEAAEMLYPYANNIDLIGSGNHETAIQKYSGTDPILWLLQLLNEKRDKKKYGLIKHGGYTGFIKQYYRYGEGHTRNYVIWYNHGTGRGGEVTGDMIALNRRKVYIDASLLWMGHTHHYQFDGNGDILYLDRSDRICIKHRRGLVTGCYTKQFEQTDSTNGYRLNYGEQTSRRLQAQGGAFLWHHIGEEIETKFILS